MDRVTETLVEHKKDDHEEVLFKRSEIAPLESYPSACRKTVRCLRPKLRWRLLRWAAATLVAIPLCVVLAVAGFSLIGIDAIGNERLRAQAEAAIERVAGFDVGVSLGELRLRPGRFSLLALEIADARIVRAADGAEIAEAGTLRVGVKVLPLFGGRLELSGITLADAELSPAEVPLLQLGAMGVGTGSAIAPADVQQAVFGTIRRAFSLTEDSGVRRVMLSNVSLRTATGQKVPHLVVERLELVRDSATSIDFSGEALYRGRPLGYQGSAVRGTGGAIERLQVAFEADGRSNTGTPGVGVVEFVLTGREMGPEQPGLLSAVAQARDILLRIEDEELAVEEASLSVGFGDGDEAFSVIGARMRMARTTLNLKGTFGPSEQSANGGPLYDFDLVSRDTVVAPEDSTEPPLPLALRLSGQVDPAASRVTAHEIDIRTSGGEVTASASVTVPQGQSPGLRLAVHVADLPTAHAKQLWPWFAASGARRWTLANLFGGRVKNSDLRLNVPPGRLGNGVPLGREEVIGRFTLSGTRFDVAGAIPPVRDGEGWVEFRGTDVEVGLSAGTIFMPGGRMVDASNGRLVIDSAHVKPRIGKLEIDVAGDAPAMVELASYEPIAASRFHSLEPDEVTGKVKGHISADIPLQDGIAARDLAWKVALDYEDLAISQPFEGQKVANANGSLLVAPDRAEIEAQADLNAVPARLSIVQPLGGSDVERKRRVELSMDDAARERMFPGLGVFVTGPFKVTYEEQGADAAKKITAALDTARLSVPWIGWRKGAGIPATATFTMSEKDGVTELSDFQLTGESFSVAGLVRLKEGRLAEARFDRVRLTRNDDYRASISSTGNGYAVNVKGAAFDARSLIKESLSDETSGGKAADSTPIELVADMDTAIGFNGETLTNVAVRYSGNSSSASRASIRGATGGFGSIAFEKETGGNGHVLRMSSDNAGAVLRFLDIYPHVEGGRIDVNMTGSNARQLAGQINLLDFWVVNEPRLGSLVAATKEAGRGGEQVDVSRVRFERGAAIISRNGGALSLEDGVLRGPLIGSTFQGTLYDADDNMAITGTFMPLYGINRIFGEIPLFGQILGNGRDRGLIGITYRLSGKLEDPSLQINPISAIAPGIFRQIFEYR
ncbi:hypothetical protein NTH_03846 [Nitratireductor thuwali]|uniref:DUF3971 domain-containing protein n=1 Tax=Nitratireductor thuwali TaxID=2267699 RepID=A0ABY5MRC7_9HYPH|nr:hypothetical protein NTH_03846 [Nitratireductor thuwali]